MAKLRLHIILAIACSGLLFSCSCSKRQEIKQSNVPYEIYTKDKTQIADCIMKNVEYYRQNHQDKDSYYWDHANFFEPYSHFYNKKTDEYVIAPIPASQYLIVKVDTIVYNSDGLKCFIFCGFETKTIKSDFLISREPERNFDAKAFVGVRNNITDSITIYPFVKYGILGYSNYKEAVSDLEYLYFNKLKGETLSASHYVHNSFEQNAGDNDFFEHSVIFQPLQLSILLQKINEISLFKVMTHLNS